MGKHSDCIRELRKKYPRARVDGFNAALRKTFANEDDLEPDVFDRVRVIPDAYIILPAVKTVICWEGRHTHPYKEGKYTDVFCILDYVFWKLVIIDVDAKTAGWQKIDAAADTMKSLKAYIDEGHGPYCPPSR